MAVNTSSGSYKRNQEQASKGFGDIKKLLQQKLQEAEILSREGIEDVVKEIQFESQSRVPVDTKALYDSSYTEVIDLGDVVVGEVGYDRDGSAPYAVYTHEIPASHPIGTDHFLLRAADVVEKDITKILQKSLNKLFR